MVATDKWGKQHAEMQRVNGTDVPLRIWNQLHYKEWLGCFSAI